jgi:hypothetical protein
VLWNEPIGLSPVDNGIFTVYFAHMPLARLDSRRLKVTRLPSIKTPPAQNPPDSAPVPTTATPQPLQGRVSGDDDEFFQAWRSIVR